MTDIKKSLLAGIESAKKAYNNINEINKVLISTSELVKEISNGKATFGIGTFYEKNESDTPLSSSIALMASTYGHDTRKKYKGLAIFDTAGKAGEEIAVWTQHENGYPCSINYNNFVLYCKNKDELENALAELLKQVKTGKAILSKMKQ